MNRDRRNLYLMMSTITLVSVLALVAAIVAATMRA